MLVYARSAMARSPMPHERQVRHLAMFDLLINRGVGFARNIDDAARTAVATRKNMRRSASACKRGVSCELLVRGGGFE
jgi:hypothetical protein